MVCIKGIVYLKQKPSMTWIQSDFKVCIRV